MDCEYRFGEAWTAQRLIGEREPRLRAAADVTRLRRVEAARGEPQALGAAIAVFSEELKHRNAPERASQEEAENA